MFSKTCFISLFLIVKYECIDFVKYECIDFVKYEYIDFVFLRFIYRVVKKEDSGTHLNELFTSPLKKITGSKLFTQSILALFSKKFTYTKKNISTLLVIVCISSLLYFLFEQLFYKYKNAI